VAHIEDRPLYIYNNRVYYYCAVVSGRAEIKTGKHKTFDIRTQNKAIAVAFWPTATATAVTWLLLPLYTRTGACVR
jgi:hypothetical protein